MTRGGLLAWVALPLAACLPKHAVSRHDELQADAYALEARVDVQTEGLPAEQSVPPFQMVWSGTAQVQWARSFRDGSIGRLVALEVVQARIVRDGATVSVPSALDGAWLELRAFDDGQVLSVEQLAPWVGTQGHVETLDVLWPVLSPVLSPRIPELSVGQAAHDEVSYPTRIEGGPRLQTRMSLDWTLRDVRAGVGDYTVSGSARASSPTVDSTASLEGALRVDGRSARLLRHASSWTRTVDTRWPSGARVSQRQSLSLTLEWIGSSPAVPLEGGVDLVRGDDPVADATSLRRADGRAPPPLVGPLIASLPFLLLPDDLPDDRLTEVRRVLLGPATLPSSVGALPPPTGSPVTAP